jgi:hypothetical protein
VFDADLTLFNDGDTRKRRLLGCAMIGEIAQSAYVDTRMSGRSVGPGESDGLGTPLGTRDHWKPLKTCRPRSDGAREPGNTNVNVRKAPSLRVPVAARLQHA